MSTSPSGRKSSADEIAPTASDINADDAQQFQQIIRDRKYEREDIQKKAFTKWINNQLVDTSSTPAVNDLFQDLRDGVVLLRLLEVLTGNEYKRENGKMRVHHIGNVNKVIAVLNEHGIKLLSISSNDIVDGNPKLTLALIWSIIQYWQGKDVIKSAEPDSRQTNIEKFLLSWCQQQTQGYKGVEINDFTRSWQDGLAFNALIHKFHPELFDYEEILQNTTARNLEHAFSIAKNVFKIDRYLDVEDFLSDIPDKKSVLMYVMCLFQQLPSSTIIIEDKEKTATTMTNTEDDDNTMETKSPSESESVELLTYQTNMERILKWILQLEDELDKQGKFTSHDLKSIKEQFQNHEEFMISLTQDQNQIGDVLQQGNQLLTSTDIHLSTDEENQIKEQMKTLNSRWESLRSKSLDRQTLLHKTLMELQMNQIDSFDTWLNETEQRISRDLENLAGNLVQLDQQYQQLAQLQDELVAQQQITESLQNMIIVIDENSSSEIETSSSKYTSNQIEIKLLNLSERWATICNFVQNRWIELQEVKILFEQTEDHRNKVDKWLSKVELEINSMKSSSNVNDPDVLMQHVNTIEKIESEMDDIRQSILALDKNFKVLRTHYQNSSSTEFQQLDEQITQIEKRWSKFVDDLEQCSTRMKTSQINVDVRPRSEGEETSKPTITTTTTIVDDSKVKKRKTDNENNLKGEFDLSARKYLDWIDSIERILDEKPGNEIEPSRRKEIIQEIKTKYFSYDDQFQTLIQTGNTITKQLKDANEDSTEHEALVKTLQIRWQKLREEIVRYENELEQAFFQSELEELTKVRSEYQTWLDALPASTSKSELQVKLKGFQEYNDRITNLRRMADRFDSNTSQRTEDLLRSWDDTNSRIRERTIPIEVMQQQTSGTATTDISSVRQTESSSSITTGVQRTGALEQSATTTTNLNPSIGENGSLFTLTNIYTFGGNDTQANQGSSNKYNVKSFVEVFDQPSSQQETEYERHFRETHSSSSYSRKVRTSATDGHDYGDNRNYDGSQYQHHYEIAGPSSSTTRHIYEHRSSGTGDLSSLSSVFTDTQRTLRLWLEHVEQSLLNDKIRIVDIHSINIKKKVYKDLLDQTFEQEHNLETLNELARESYSKLSIDVTRRLQQELINYRDRLLDIKMFLSDRVAKYNRYEKTLTEFESGVDEVKLWIRNAQPRLTTIDTSSRGLESQLGRNQVLQNEIREMQITVNRLNKDVIDLTQDADETLARRLRDEMQRLNESWSHIISSTKVYSQNIQDTLKRNRIFQEEIREIEEWILEKERDISIDDGAIFYQEQLRERLEQYQRLQTELNLKEYTVRTLVDQARQDVSQTSSSELVHSLDTLISNWSSLQKKVDHKLAFYTDSHQLNEELRDLLRQENHWLDTLQNKIYGNTYTSADAEETSEELDSLERFLKTHSKANYDKILEIADRLQTTKISIPTTNSQINQFQIRWEQLHGDAMKKIHSLNSQVTDYQQLGQQINATFEWIRHTDSILNARLKDNIYADDVPAEADKLTVEFHQHESFLRSIEERIHTLRSLGKHDASKRLEQQYSSLKSQFIQLQNKFRHFQKPSDFEPKYTRVRQVLHDVEQNLHTLEIRSDEPDVVHSQLEHCLKLYKTLSEIKTEVEYVIRVGRTIVDRGQTEESNDLTRQIDQLKATYNNLGSKVSTAKTQLDSVERHLRRFRKDYSHIHEWFVKADHEIRKIENKPVSKNTREEVDWLRTTRSDIRKLDANFESLRTLERNIQREAERAVPSLHDKITELRRQIDQLDRRLRDRSEIVEGQVRKLDSEYERFSHIYQEIIVRLDRLETLLSDAERVLDVTRISQVQEELRSVRTQLDEILNLGQELVSRSEKYSKLIGPDIENITRKFEDIQRRIRVIQETQEKRRREEQTITTTTTNRRTQDDQQDDVRQEYYSEKRYNRTERESRRRSPSEISDVSTTHGVVDEEFKKKYLRCLAYMKLIERLYENQIESDEDVNGKYRRTSRRGRTIEDRPEYEEIERIIRETEERAYIIEKTDVEQARRIREKIRRLKECLENLRARSDHYEANDEVVRYNERYEEHIRTSDRTVPAPREREFDSDFIYDIDDTRSVISEPAPHYNKYRKTVHSMERYRTDDQARYVPTHEEYQLQPLLRVRSLKAIDHRTLSAPSSPILQPRYRSYERSNVQYTKQSSAQQGHQDNFQSSISKSASMPNGGFPLQQSLLPHPPPPPNFHPQQPMTYRERVIDKHVAERSTSRGESHRQQHQESSGQVQQQQTRSASAGGQSQTLNRSIPVRYEASNAHSSSSGGFRQTNGFSQEQHPSYFYTEQHGTGGGSSSGGGGGGFSRQQHYDQQTYPSQNVGRHPTRIVN